MGHAPSTNSMVCTVRWAETVPRTYLRYLVCSLFKYMAAPWPYLIIINNAAELRLQWTYK